LVLSLTEGLGITRHALGAIDWLVHSCSQVGQSHRCAWHALSASWRLRSTPECHALPSEEKHRSSVLPPGSRSELSQDQLELSVLQWRQAFPTIHQSSLAPPSVGPLRPSDRPRVFFRLAACSVATILSRASSARTTAAFVRHQACWACCRPNQSRALLPLRRRSRNVAFQSPSCTRPTTRPSFGGDCPIATGATRHG
jgi:hypothetical protein